MREKEGVNHQRLSFFFNHNLTPRTEGNMVESQVRFFKMSLVIISNFKHYAVLYHYRSYDHHGFRNWHDEQTKYRRQYQLI